MRATVAMAKRTRIAEALNIRVTDDRFLQYINEATERLLKRGKYWGTCVRYAISVEEQLMTLPPELAVIERINVANYPLPLRSRWFEFLDFGYGTRDESLPNGTGINECILRGRRPHYKSMTADDVLTVKCDVSDDVGKTVRIFGYDTDGNWIRTETAGIWTDGVEVALATGVGTTTTQIFASNRITDIQVQTKDDGSSALEGQWWLYQGIDAVAGPEIGHYQYWETNPSYQLYLIPFINSTATTVQVMAKLAFRQVVNDTDYLIIGNLAALKLGCMALKAEEEHSWMEANLLWEGGVNKDGSRRIGAAQLLDQELGHFTGDGEQLGIRMINSNIGFGQMVEPLM